MATVLVQRVNWAYVDLGGEKRKIRRGLLVYVGFEREDTEEVIPKIARKILNLRVFEDDRGRMNLSVRDIRGEILIVPNFTLAGSARKGNRPEFTGAKAPQEAEKLFYMLCDEMDVAERGEFRSYMRVVCENDGPANFILNF